MAPEKRTAVDGRIESTAPVFILSCERSGSTLLRYIVDTHQDIACPAELRLGQLCVALYHSAYYSVGQVVATTEIERSSRTIERIRHFTSALMAEYTTAKGKRLWCDKSPENLETLEILDTVFPDAKYICLHRNCMDVVHSCLEISGRDKFSSDFAPYIKNNPENMVAAMVESWAAKTRKLLTFERENQHKCFRITYESLVLDTHSSLAAMFDFLDLSFDPSLLDSVFLVAHDDGPGDDRIRFSSKINKDSLGKGSLVSRAQIPVELLEQMNALLSELAYPLVGPDWDNVPSVYLHTVQSEGVATVEEIFRRHFPALLKRKKESAAKLSAICKIAVRGAGGGNWILNLAESSVGKDRGEVKPDCVVTILENDFIDMVSGRLNPMAALDRGRLGIAGDRDLAMRVGVFLFGT